MVNHIDLKLVRKYRELRERAKDRRAFLFDRYGYSISASIRVPQKNIDSL